MALGAVPSRIDRTPTRVNGGIAAMPLFDVSLHFCSCRRRRHPHPPKTDAMDPVLTRRMTPTMALVEKLLTVLLLLI